jgi:hypothetical protein
MAMTSSRIYGHLCNHTMWLFLPPEKNKLLEIAEVGNSKYVPIYKTEYKNIT